MQTIEIPERSVVIVVGGPRKTDAADIARLADALDMPASPWDVNKPKESAEALRTALTATGSARVAMFRAHASARRQAATIARKTGAATVVLRLPGSDPVDARAERVDLVVDVAGPAATRFRVVPMPAHLVHLTGGTLAIGGADLSRLNGPFDIIGDVHGCHDELIELLSMLGHVDDEGRPVRHREGRVPVLLGDLTDRGPANLAVLETARAMAAVGAIVLRGNHDEKLRKWLSGRDVRVAAGLAGTIAELERTVPQLRADIGAWLGTLHSHAVLDGGRLAVAHAGIPEALQGRPTSEAEAFGLYGRSIDGGRTLDADGHPQTEDWALTYAGTAVVVHGHVVYPAPRIVNGVHAIDTGCVFGGALTAMRWPERDFVRVEAHRVYFNPRGRDAAA